MTDLDKLKDMIDEENYPYFTDVYLQSRLDSIGDEGQSFESLIRELCLTKSNIEEIKLGDIIIPSPRKHFLMLASQYRKSNTGTVVRVDGR